MSDRYYEPQSIAVSRRRKLGKPEPMGDGKRKMQLVDQLGDQPVSSRRSSFATRFAAALGTK